MIQVEIMTKFKQIRAKNSSLAIDIFHDDANEFSFYIFNRRTHSIIAHYKIPLMQHCRDSMIDVRPIIKKRKK